MIPPFRIVTVESGVAPDSKDNPPLFTEMEGHVGVCPSCGGNGLLGRYCSNCNPPEGGLRPPYMYL